MGGTDGVAGIEELVAGLRAIATSSSLAALRPMFANAADALEHQQANLQRKTEAFDSAITQLAEDGARLDNMQAVVEAARLVLPYWSGEPTPRYPAEEKVLRQALAALDAKPEGEG